ncbi:hypothetical protein [Kribbella sp. NPDC004536]|uniref:hypothetical protein n=1 Tax=Kribbella sp. NPDC004536 TaxID=3364106 RepID=UPI003697C49B
MSTDDDIFLTPWAVDEVAEWMAEVLALEPLAAPDLDEGEYFYKRRSPLVEGRDALLLVGPNIHSVADPEPDEVSAIDGYTGMISVRIAGMRSEWGQAREACALFNELAAVRPGVAMVLRGNPGFTGCENFLGNCVMNGWAGRHYL